MTKLSKALFDGDELAQQLATKGRHALRHMATEEPCYQPSALIHVISRGLFVWHHFEETNNLADRLQASLRSVFEAAWLPDNKKLPVSGKAATRRIDEISYALVDLLREGAASGIVGETTQDRRQGRFLQLFPLGGHIIHRRVEFETLQPLKTTASAPLAELRDAIASVLPCWCRAAVQLQRGQVRQLLLSERPSGLGPWRRSLVSQDHSVEMVTFGPFILAGYAAKGGVEARHKVQ